LTLQEKNFIGVCMAHKESFLKLLEKSLKLIRENPSCFVDEVPEELAIAWITDSGSDGVGFCVFVAGWCRAKALLDESAHRKNGKQLAFVYNYGCEAMKKNYFLWRARLALSIITKRTPLSTFQRRALFLFQDEHPDTFIDQDLLNRYSGWNSLKVTISPCPI